MILERVSDGGRRSMRVLLTVSLRPSGKLLRYFRLETIVRPGESIHLAHTKKCLRRIKREYRLKSATDLERQLLKLCGWEGE